MSNPFDKQDSRFLVLTNDRGQYSLWPSFIQIPSGWTSCAEGGRQDCLDYITKSWSDMRPRRLGEENGGDLPSSN